MKKKLYIMLLSALTLGGTFTSCSDNHMESVNTDDTKSPTINPNAQLTTALLQTYGDFGLMDTYRSYITGFTQYFAGGWNVSFYAGAVNPDNDQMRLIWDQYYSVGIKNLVDAIHNSKDMPNTNAALRIHRVYLMSILTDTYGDIPCSEAGLGFIEGISNPKYDKQEDIYNWFFAELKDCVSQLGTGSDRISGDVTSLNGDTDLWKKYANSLILRFAMRISDVNPALAQQEFEGVLASESGYIGNSSENAYVKYLDAPFTLYDGSRDLDFRANALSEILYGQDPTSPTFVCSTLYNMLKDNNDPRLLKICRNYINTTRSETKPEGCFDVTDDMVAWENAGGTGVQANDPGAAWWDQWPTVPATSEIPTLQQLVNNYPDKGYDQSNYPARMTRPFLALAFEQPNCPGILITSAEVEFLLAEAATKGWAVQGDAESHYEAGIRAAMQLLNDCYDIVGKISETDINDYIAANPLGDNPKEQINKEAYILHLTNPAEAWANLRRSDYPVLQDRAKFGNFTYTCVDGFKTPVRLKYPNLEAKYNSVNYKEAIERLGGTDDWHKRMWWDVAEQNFQ
ncbi:MAG: SusD/RagB family nutrient-binding outer membrane lipoprotein [Prevotella sp.]|nr:SusD/RagB family nutrient-binding outer membrane lipoprotein [Prevotella sp.]MDD7029272.1 SusD/RagB family nutrient-binding outer membrane lipoprotein [Prevotellaceae bacterium]MDD7074643.1 SusD/RagB family nutrient-binding outer membrane lipoprotein [Prevotellaceae bacterium]MDY4628605.1 SusD/RagB family nutrient-binding outer membrane lipoprotein [Prevotella sp.]MDY5209089.1 SusD/RagB family nutrient-binding outer membrane lipoprotein [Prevotella sp.]